MGYLNDLFETNVHERPIVPFGRSVSDFITGDSSIAVNKNKSTSYLGRN